MARTIFLGEPSVEQVSMYDYLRDRVGEGIRAVRVGLTLVELRRLFYQGFRLKQGWGVRFEDTFLVTQDGPVVLTGQG